MQGQLGPPPHLPLLDVDVGGVLRHVPKLFQPDLRVPHLLLLGSQLALPEVLPLILQELLCEGGVRDAPLTGKGLEPLRLV